MAQPTNDRREVPVDPAQPIVDAHHHLYVRPDLHYLLEDYLDDLRGGHNILATIYVQARSMLRQAGPDVLRSLGETEFANGVAAMCASGLYGDARICAGIVGQADLCPGAAVRPVLESHMAAAGHSSVSAGRFKGIRHVAAWDPDSSLLNPAYPTTRQMLGSAGFREGFAQLHPLGLSFDAWIYFHQIPQLVDLARTFPQTAMVINHCGGVLGVGRYAGRQSEVYEFWAAAMRELAACPNVMVKLGGLGMPLTGLKSAQPSARPHSRELAELWRPWIEHCISEFGTARCMFESNFPADKAGHDYVAGWNAFQRIVAGASATEKADLFWRTACRFYRIPLAAGDAHASVESGKPF